MPSEERKGLALDAIGTRNELFRSALAVTADQVRGMLAGSGDAEDDQAAALGFFAQGKVDVGRFAAFAPRAARLEVAVEAPVRAAQQVLASLLGAGDDLYVVGLKPGKDLACKVSTRLALIGRAFAAARVVELARRGEYREKEHAQMLEKFPFSRWSSAERALVPALVIELSGADFQPAAMIPLLDANTKYVFNVLGDAPAAGLARVISPGVFVQQETGTAPLEAFASFDGMAVAALLPATAVSFIHDPSAGTQPNERFSSLQFPKEVKKRVIGGISVAQQAEDYALLESLASVPVVTGDAASDPAGKLSAWLLSQTNLSA